MRHQTDFTARIATINKTAAKNGIMRRTSKRRLGDRLVTPVMLACCLAGGVTVAWDMQDRPTDTPLEYAGDLTAMVMTYINTI